MSRKNLSEFITLKRSALALLCLACLVVGSCLSCGCSALDAWKGGIGYNHKTGEARGELKGAGKGGEYNENKGLNLGLDLGDNTVPALIIAGGLGVLALSSYPIQRALRLRKEKQWLERLEQLRGATGSSSSLASSSVLASPTPNGTSKAG